MLCIIQGNLSVYNTFLPVLYSAPFTAVTVQAPVCVQQPKKEDAACPDRISPSLQTACFYGSSRSVFKSDKMIALHDLEIFHNPRIQRLRLFPKSFFLKFCQLHHGFLPVDQRP